MLPGGSRSRLGISVYNAFADRAVLHDELFVVKIITDVFIAVSVNRIGKSRHDLVKPAVFGRSRYGIMKADITLRDILLFSESGTVFKGIANNTVKSVERCV
jgi:hypothetical protein